jgi:SAM-dependent methyltransferase
MPDRPDLSAALTLRSPADSLRLYRAWAETYDTDFAAPMEYRLPAHVAAAFLAGGGAGQAGPDGAGPVLDVGAGTGLLAGALRAQGYAGDIDAVDLSPEMLERARAKGLYRRLLVADITRPLPFAGGYRGVVSSGTFTSGHVGPEGIGPLLDRAAPGALFALSINAAVYRSAGFDRALADPASGIADLALLEVAIYGPSAAAIDPAHAAQTALIALFRKAR